MTGRHVRFILLPVGGAVLGIGFLWTAWKAFESGLFAPRPRFGIARSIAYGSDPIVFSITLGALVLLGIVLVCGAIFSLALLWNNERKDADAIDQTVRDWEVAAPSGLAPLWIALAVFVLAFAAYAML